MLRLQDSFETHTCAPTTQEETDPHQRDVWIQNFVPSLNILHVRTANYSGHMLIWTGLKYTALGLKYIWRNWICIAWEGVHQFDHTAWDQGGTPSRSSQFSGASALAKNMMLMTLRFFWLAVLWPVTLLTDSRHRQKNAHLGENMWHKHEGWEWFWILLNYIAFFFVCIAMHDIFNRSLGWIKGWKKYIFFNWGDNGKIIT